MGNLIRILFFICLLCFIIGMINPRLVIWWGAFEKRNRIQVLKYYGTVFITIFILVGIIVNPPKKSTPTTPVIVATNNDESKQKAEADLKAQELEGSLIATTQDIIKKNLKSPSTAVFPVSFDEYDITDSDAVTEGFKGHRIVGYVDSENSFGAKIRSTYVLVLELSEDLKQYKVISCTIK